MDEKFGELEKRLVKAEKEIEIHKDKLTKQGSIVSRNKASLSEHASVNFIYTIKCMI